jgi:hypothetical protein
MCAIGITNLFSSCPSSIKPLISCITNPNRNNLNLRAHSFFAEACRYNIAVNLSLHGNASAALTGNAIGITAEKQCESQPYNIILMCCRLFLNTGI